MLAQTLLSQPSLPRAKRSYSPCQARRYLGTVLPRPRDARRPARSSSLVSPVSHLETNPPPPLPLSNFALFLSLVSTMASEGEPTIDDSFTPRQLERIRELIVANRPPPSAEAETHRPPPAETPGPSSGAGRAHGEFVGIGWDQAHAWRGRDRCQFFARLTLLEA